MAGSEELPGGGRLDLVSPGEKERGQDLIGDLTLTAADLAAPPPGAAPPEPPPPAPEPAYEIDVTDVVEEVEGPPPLPKPDPGKMLALQANVHTQVVRAHKVLARAREIKQLERELGRTNLIDRDAQAAAARKAAEQAKRRKLLRDIAFGVGFVVILIGATLSVHYGRDSISQFFAERFSDGPIEEAIGEAAYADDLTEPIEELPEEIVEAPPKPPEPKEVAPEPPAEVVELDPEARARAEAEEAAAMAAKLAPDLAEPATVEVKAPEPAALPAKPPEPAPAPAPEPEPEPEKAPPPEPEPAPPPPVEAVPEKALRIEVPKAPPPRSAAYDLLTGKAPPPAKPAKGKKPAKTIGKAIVQPPAQPAPQPAPAPPPEPAAEEKPSEPAPPEAGYLVINSSVAGVQIEIFDVKVGKTPLPKLELDPGRYTVWGSKPGFEMFEADVVVAAGKTATLAIKMVPIPPVDGKKK